MAADERRRRILDAAAAVFGENGYSASSIDRVARACGMSRRTIYSLFASKAQLFAELVTRVVPAVGEPLAPAGARFEEALAMTMDGVAAISLDPRQVALFRLAVAESHLAPEITRAYLEDNFKRGRKYLAGTIAELARSFGRPDDDYLEIADILYGSVVALPMIHALVDDTRTHTLDSTAKRSRRLIAALSEQMRVKPA
jgi:AcrR family transcriptional regulator